MRISARCDYACRALLELALHWPGTEPLRIHTISERQKIPMRYLVQILLQLKQIGLVVSIRGKKGGYNIAKAPNAISLGEVMRQIGGPLLPVANSGNSGIIENSTFSTIWNEVESAMAKVLDKITFEDISNRAKGMKNTIIYQI